MSRLRTAPTLVVLALAPAAAGAASARAIGRSHVLPVILHAGTRPRHFCPDNRTCAIDMHWRSWSATRAVGAGRMTFCPGGGVGRCRTRVQSITYTDPERMCGTVSFTRFRYQYWQQAGVLKPSGPGQCLWYDQ